MSRRLPTSPLAGLLFLLFLGAMLSPLLAVPASAFGERPYQSNKVISGTSHLNVYSGERVAQSFLVTTSYRLFNVTLRLRNAGDTTDPINITIQTDARGIPSGSIVTSAQLTIGTNTLANYNVPFPLPAALNGGESYWIVASSSSSLLNNYEWHDSAGNVYPNGAAKVDMGSGWSDPVPVTDLYFVTYGRETDTNLTTNVVASQSTADVGETLSFRVYLNNTGDLAAAKAWLNDTQLPGFTHLSDTAAAAGATTPWPAFTFSNVGNGVRSFDLIARVNGGTEPGTVLTKAFGLAYVNGTGGSQVAPSTQASVLIGLESKPLYLDPQLVGASERLDPTPPTGGPAAQHNETLPRNASAHDFDLEPVLGRAFHVIGVDTTLYLDSASHDTRSLTINLTLADWNGVTLIPLAYTERKITTNAFQDYEASSLSFPAFDHTFAAGSRVRFTVRNMGSSADDAILAMNSTFAASRLDLATTTYVRIDLIDLRDAIGSTTVWSPKDSLVIQANVSDPFGSLEIAGARVNLTSPSGTVLVNDTAMALIATDPGNPSSWKVFQFIVPPQLSQGTYRTNVTAREANGVHDFAEATALVRSPSFNILKTATRSNVRSGDRYTYDIWFNNTGTGPAGRVWINDSLPTALTFQASSDPGAMTGNYNWTWTSLGVGNYHLGIDVRVNSGLPPTPFFRNSAFLNYTDEKGFSWPMLIDSADVAYRGPVISLTITSAKTYLHSNESIVYQITLQNTGDAAQTLWVNDTLPTDLAYVSDTVSTLGGSTAVFGNLVFFVLSNMPGPQTWTFTLTAVAAPNLVRGSALTNPVSLNFTNSNGYLLPSKDTSWTVHVTAPRIVSGLVSIAMGRVAPTDVISAAISFTNSGNEPARDVWVNLTLDQYLIFLNATLRAFVVGRDVRFNLTNAPLGQTVILMNASVDAAVGDHAAMSVTGTIRYTDGFGNVLSASPIVSDLVEASTPRIVLIVTPGVTSVEAATLVFYNIYQVNAGSGVAGDVWLTLPLPASFLYINDTADSRPTIVGSTYTWHWSNVLPGSTSFSLELEAKSTVLNGTRANLTFHTDYTDVNGNFRPGITTYSIANFVAPQIDLVLEASTHAARPGDTVTFTVTVRNNGGSAAQTVWLTTFVNRSVQVLSWNVRPVGTTLLNWSLRDMQPGQEAIVTLIVQIANGVPVGTPIITGFESEYTNSAGTILGGSGSDLATVTIAPPPLDLLPFVWIALSGVGLGLGAILVVRWRSRVQIEEVFLVYKDGVLIYHLSRSLSQDKDEDVLSGMLTAVQEFVRDAFAYGEHRELHQLDFGDYRIMIERGRNLYLAVVYSGKGASSIRKRVRQVLDHIETAYGSVLAKWDGDMDKVVGARDLIREYLLKKSNGRSFKGLPGLP